MPGSHLGVGVDAVFAETFHLDLARRLDESARLIDLQDKRVELGVRLAEIYRDRWENGEIDILEYVRSQNDLENSKIQLVNLKSSYMALLAQYQFTAVAGE